MTYYTSSSSSMMSRSMQGHINRGFYKQNDKDKEDICNINLELSRDIYRYQILNSIVVNNLNYYINLFTRGNYQDLKKLYTDTKRKNLSLILGNDAYFYNTNIDTLNGYKYIPTTFNSFRSSSKALISGLEMSIKQFDQVKELDKDVKYYENILSTENNIIEYLNQHKEVSQMAFNNTQVFKVQPVLKPWYEKYLAVYGPPNDGVFQNDLMADIVINLIREGVITEQEFITNTYNG